MTINSVSRDRRPDTFQHRIAPFLRYTQAAMLDSIQFHTGMRVLSIECRDGWAAEEVWRRIRRGYVCGVDLSPSMIARTQLLRGVEGTLEFRAWDGHRLPFPDGAFDVVFTTFGLNRFNDPFPVMREARRVLGVGGEILLLEPDRSSFYGLYGLWDLVRRRGEDGHFRYYSMSDMRELLVRAGFGAPRMLLHEEKVWSRNKLLASAIAWLASR